MTNLGHRSTLSFFPVLFAGIVVGLNYPSPLSADNAQTHIVFDGSTGTNKTMVNDIADGIADNVFVIDSADGSGQRGANLFHSFDEFSIANGDTAQFTDLSNSNFSNVILRVTGGNESSIYGTIQTGEGLDTANLYLLNPTGIIFGDGASVDIGGSFYASTADQLKFKGEDTVMPTGTTSSTFYSADVEAFGFINPNPAAITVSGVSLSVDPGESLTLIGGDIGLSGATLQAANGTIQIASVGGEAYVPAKLANYGSTVSDDLGTIGLSNGATIDTGGNAGGSIIIRGGKLMMDDSSISNKTNFMYNGEQDLSGIDIDIEGSISLDNAGQITTLNEGMGTAAPINIKAGAALNIANKSFISASAGNFNSEGRGGDIDISAETVTITGVIGAPPPNPDAFEVVTITGIHSDGALFGDSPSGNISVDANNITVENNGGIFANSSGSITGGDINLDANGGSINITDGGRIEIVSILEGAGGNINLHAKTINLSGGAFALNNRSSYQQSRIVINTTISSSAAGNVNIESEQFSLTDGAIISTVTQQGQGGGNVTINSDLVYLSDFNTSGMASSDNTTYNSQEAVDGKTGFASKISTFQSFSEISGNESGGNITLNSNKITISEYATLETVTEGISDNNTITLIGGNIALRADDITIQQNSKLSTAQLDNDGSNTARGNGNISITANDSLIIDTSTIETKIYSSIGSGGDISINANKLLLKNSVFDTSANNGDGGNISIKSAQAIITPDNIFNTNSANEINGVIDIEIYKLDDKTAITTPPHNTEQVLLNTSPCDIEKHLGNSSLFVGHRTKTSMIYPSTTILAESSTQLRHQPFEVLAANTSSCSRKFNGRM